MVVGDVFFVFEVVGDWVVWVFDVFFILDEDVVDEYIFFFFGKVCVC